MANSIDNVPDKKVPMLVNLLGLGIPGAKANLENERAEQEYTAQRNRYGAAAASLGLGAGDIGAITQTASADPSVASGMLAAAAERNMPLTQAQQLALENAQQNLSNARQQGELNQIQLDQAKLPQPQSATEQWLGMPVGTMPKPPAGYQLAINPYNQAKGLAPVQGTKEYIKSDSEVRSTERIIQSLNEYAGLVEQYGTEYGTRTAQKMTTLLGQIQADILVARNFGAPQAAELERVEAALADATSIWNNLQGLMLGGPNPLDMSTQKQRMAEGIREQIAITERVAGDMYKNYYWVAPQPGVVRPSTIEGLYSAGRN